MKKLVLLRHGESEWNKENRFTGWTDVGLSPEGIEEAREAGLLLKRHGFSFDIAYTSFLERALHTLLIVLKEMHLENIPIEKSWRLNERHYGALQGLNKKDTAHKYGDEQVHIWRRSYDVRPPALDESDERFPGNDPKYACLNKKDLPRTECLKDTVDRVIPYWEGTISEDVAGGKHVLVSAHGNSLRALVKYLDNIPDKDIINLNIPTGVPLVYELDEGLQPLAKYYLK